MFLLTFPWTVLKAVGEEIVDLTIVKNLRCVVEGCVISLNVFVPNAMVEHAYLIDVGCRRVKEAAAMLLILCLLSPTEIRIRSISPRVIFFV